MRAFAFMKVAGEEQKSAIVLNPAYLNPETLNGMLVTVNNRMNAHRGTQSPDGIVVSDVSRPYRPINPRALPALNSLLARLREQPVRRVGTLGTGRAITIEDLAEYVRANELPVSADKSL